MRPTCRLPSPQHPSRVRGSLRSTVGLSVLIIAAAASGVQAQSEWNPFKEQDERAARRRPAELPPPMAPVDRQVFRPGSGPADGSPRDGASVPFGAPYPGTGDASRNFESPGNAPTQGSAGRSTVEKIELAPIEALPAKSGPSAAGGAQTPAIAAPAPVGGPSSASATAALRPAVPSSGPLWQGVDMAQLEGLIAPLAVPPRSPALHALWTRLLTDQGPPPSGGKGPNHFAALQMEGLYRSGLIEGLSQKLASDRGDGADPLVTAFRIRRDLATGDRAAACTGAKSLAAKRQGLPKLLAGEVHLLGGYCAAADGNFAAAGLSAELAREEEVQASAALQALDALALQQPASKGAKPPRLALPERLLVLDYRLLSLLGPVEPGQVLEKAEPALLYALASETKGDARLTVLAAESAARANALSPTALGEAYAKLAVPAAAEADPLFRRASLFKALVAEPGPPRRMALMRQFLDDARRSGLYLPAARAAALRLGDLDPAGTPAPLVETATEVALAGGDYARARQLAMANPAVAHWAALADIADPRGVRPADIDRSLGVLEALARSNRVAPDVLHRLATVLDALDVNVPIPLWEAASRTPQPNTGHLPETGTLAELAAAAKKREVGRTVLLTMRTLGAGGPDTAHLIALGDSIRALRRVGLDEDARRIGFEALFAGWPRGVSQ